MKPFFFVSLFCALSLTGCSFMPALMKFEGQYEDSKGDQIDFNVDEHPKVVIVAALNLIGSHEIVKT